MYKDGGQTTGFHRITQPNAPCHCQSCVQYEPPFPHHGLPGQRVGAAQTDHPSLDHGRDVQAPRPKDVGGRALAEDRVDHGGHRSPQRRPVFTGPGAYGQQPNSTGQIYPWDSNAAQWGCPPEPGPGPRHYPFVREQCGCVVWTNTRAHSFNSRLPLQETLPHLQVKGRGHRHRRVVRYASQGDEEECWGCRAGRYQWELPGPPPGLFLMPNGHCGPGTALCEGGEGRDNHQDRGRLRGGSETSCNGPGPSNKGFFPTEVPQKHLNQSRRKGPCIPPTVTASQESSKSATGNDHQGSEATQHRRSQDSVREQIRQVVTDLEDVLGGLKQVHVEMKEVVEQIDRLTANIDLSEEMAHIAHVGSNHLPISASTGDLSLIPATNHRPSLAQVAPLDDEDRIILRTNSPSPVHMASVVKTSRVAPPAHHKAFNGHPPHLYSPRDSNHLDQTPAEPPSHSPVVSGNSTSVSRTQKPPPYPQNGRCVKGSYLPPKPTRTPAHPGRGRHSTSMV